MSERSARGAVQDGGPAVDDPEQLPIGDLINKATEQTSRLIREEMQLARLEMQQKLKHAGISAGMFGAAGIVARFGVGALVAMAILALALATAIDAWLAAPEQAIDSVHEDIDEIKARSHR